jgi:hypothetical protein
VNCVCKALGCDRVIPSHLLMCREHWFGVPAAVRQAVWLAYEPGQERRDDASPAYLLAARRAVCAVAVRERKMTGAEARADLTRLAAALGEPSPAESE